MDSTLMISAPQSARCISTVGPAHICVMPTTLIPSSGSFATSDNPPFPQFRQVLFRVPQGGIDLYVMLPQQRCGPLYLPGQLRTYGRPAWVGQLAHHRVLSLCPEASPLGVGVCQQVFGGIYGSTQNAPFLAGLNNLFPGLLHQPGVPDCAQKLLSACLVELIRPTVGLA